MGKSRKMTLAFALLGLLACLLALAYYYWNAGQAERAFDYIREHRPYITLQPEASESSEDGERPYSPDCIAWVTIPDTGIDYPVMQREGANEYYLRRDFYGEYSESGTPFLDTTCKIDDPASPLYIFGHNMKSGTMFAELLNYRDVNFLKEHPIVELTTEDGVQKYEIFAVLETKNGTDELGIYDFAADSERDLASFYSTLQEKALYDTGISPSGRLLVLITCTNSYDNAGRFYVAAHQVE